MIKLIRHLLGRKSYAESIQVSQAQRARKQWQEHQPSYYPVTFKFEDVARRQPWVCLDRR